MFNPADPGPDYELAWPPELFVAEANAVLASRNHGWRDSAEVLLREAFAGDTPAEDLRTVRWSDIPPEMHDPDCEPDDVLDDDVLQRTFLLYLVSCAAQLPGPMATKPYWSVRNAPETAEGPTNDQKAAARLQREWWQLVEDLRARGYLSRVAPERAGRPDGAASVLLDLELEKRLGVADLWSMGGEGWTPDEFYSLVESIHDLIARPRQRAWDMSGEGRWCYMDFAPAPGRALYRWQVNQLLARHAVGLQLASDGEDVGRLVRATDDAREDLVERAQQSPDPGTRADVSHAIALFRGRTATTADRRSAVIALAGILERRQRLLKRELFSQDEDALFLIANRFDLRHRAKSQQSDYDPIFLDWLFWWYLATVELTDKLFARQDSETP